MNGPSRIGDSVEPDLSSIPLSNRVCGKSSDTRPDRTHPEYEVRCQVCVASGAGSDCCHQVFTESGPERTRNALPAEERRVAYDCVELAASLYEEYLRESQRPVEAMPVPGHGNLVWHVRSKPAGRNAEESGRRSLTLRCRTALVKQGADPFHLRIEPVLKRHSAVAGGDESGAHHCIRGDAELGQLRPELIIQTLLFAGVSHRDDRHLPQPLSELGRLLQPEVERNRLETALPLALRRIEWSQRS